MFITFQFFSGIDEAVKRNIDACNELAKTTRSAFGPNGNDISLKSQEQTHSNYFHTILLVLHRGAFNTYRDS